MVCPGKQSFNSQFIMNGNWLTLQETMQYLKLKSKSSVYKYIGEKKIRVTKVLSNTLFSKIDIDKALEEAAITF
ncbi:MAG: helix-turn-helix domain-containing protein [Agriterribacter sp.]